jgi:hypothetical protein
VPRRFWRSLASLTVVACGLGAFWWGTFWNPSVPGQISATLLCALLLVAVTAALTEDLANLTRWVLPRRAVLVLDADGIHMPRYSCTLTWPGLAEIRLTGMYADRRKGKPDDVVAFVPADLASTITSLRPRGWLRRMTVAYGTPLAFRDQFWDESAEQVAAAATAFMNVPVRRYPRC